MCVVLRPFSLSSTHFRLSGQSCTSKHVFFSLLLRLFTHLTDNDIPMCNLITFKHLAQHSSHLYGQFSCLLPRIMTKVIYISDPHSDSSTHYLCAGFVQKQASDCGWLGVWRFPFSLNIRPPDFTCLWLEVCYSAALGSILVIHVTLLNLEYVSQSRMFWLL